MTLCIHRFAGLELTLIEPSHFIGGTSRRPSIPKIYINLRSKHPKHRQITSMASPAVDEFPCKL
jgi:hypothetical protein